MSTYLEDMVGKAFTEVKMNDDKTELYFINADEVYTMYHDQYCCENVSIEDICGELSTLENVIILSAEEVTSADDTNYESATWTFYLFSTNKGYVTIRWIGESNGYYSESVSIKYTSLRTVNDRYDFRNSIR